jgi:hypothetical protein
MNFRSKIFILTGIYFLLGAWLARTLTFQYHHAEMGINLLPLNLFEMVLFAIAFLVFLATCLTIWFLTRKNKSPISMKKRFNFLIPSFVAWIILYLLLDRNHHELIIPVALVLFGLILFNLNRYVTSRLVYFSYSLMLLGVLAFIFREHPWEFLFLGFGLFPIIFGIIVARKKQVPQTGAGH